MKNEDIPFNMGFDYDDELFEVAHNFEEMEKGIDFLKDINEEMAPSTKKVILLTQISSFLRVLRQLPEAEQLLDQAYEILISDYDIGLEVAIKLRYAVIHQSQKNFKDAQGYYEEAFSLFKEHSGLPKVELQRDFSYFHYARCKYQEGQYKTALDLMAKSLETRLAKGDVDLINQAQKMMGIIDRQMSLHSSQLENLDE